MHCCCSFPEGLETVTSDPLLLMAVPKTYHKFDKGGVSGKVSRHLRHHKYDRCRLTLHRGV